MLSLARPCPSCKASDQIVIDGPVIKCQKCSFSKTYGCPICNHGIDPSRFESVEKGQRFTCGNCNRQVPTLKVKYLIENGLRVDQETRCDICHGPTIYHPSMNLSHRCFYFPGCSGQTDLFGENKTESLVFLDFETTGLEIGKDMLLEFGALKIDKEGYEHTFQKFVQIPFDVPEHIEKITGITQDMVAGADSLDDVLSEFCEFVDDSILVAHNADFDIPWLVVSLIRKELKLKTDTVICTLDWAQKNQEGRSSLRALTRKYGITHANAHRALADAAATKELFFIFENSRKSPRPKRSLGEYFTLGERIVQKYAQFVQ